MDKMQRIIEYSIVEIDRVYYDWSNDSPLILDDDVLATIAKHVGLMFKHMTEYNPYQEISDYWYTKFKNEPIIIEQLNLHKK